MSTVEYGVKYLDGVRLNRCLCASIEWLISAQDELNKINVFPVPDGDTGTNLALTVDAIGVRIQQIDTRHVGELLIKAADAALDGARGNSGAIIAQFFQGLADSCQDKQRLHPKDLVKAFQAGAEYARSAIAKPQPGTILTLIDAVAGDLAVYYQENPNRDFVPLLAYTLERAEAALANTQQQLEVLRRAGVVDAGAKGFLLLLEGIGNFLARGSLRAVPVPRADPGAVATLDGFETHEGDIEHRYCTECLIHGEQIDQRKLREQLSAIGSSLIVAGTPRKTKIHVHVDMPAMVFDIAGNYGELTGRKADDMRQQAHAVSAVNKRFAVITDSAADLPDFAMEEYDIHTVPLCVHFGNQRYLDKIELTADQFFQRLHDDPEPARTSQPTPGDYRRMYDYLSVAFGDVTEGTAWDRTITIKNDGTANLQLGMLAQTDTLGGAFSILSDNCSAQIIAPAGSCVLMVRFLPASVGDFSDSFDIPSNDPDEAVLVFTVSGTGVLLGTGTINLNPDGADSGAFGSAAGPFTLWALLSLIAVSCRRRL